MEEMGNVRNDYQKSLSIDAGKTIPFRSNDLSLNPSIGGRRKKFSMCLAHFHIELLNKTKLTCRKTGRVMIEAICNAYIQESKAKQSRRPSC